MGMPLPSSRYEMNESRAAPRLEVSESGVDCIVFLLVELMDDGDGC
jgi:hypothetical protein